MVEIAKALTRAARVIVFDEPTAVVSGEEAKIAVRHYSPATGAPA